MIKCKQSVHIYITNYNGFQIYTFSTQIRALHFFVLGQDNPFAFEWQFCK